MLFLILKQSCEKTYILPVLLQQGDQEVHTHLHILKDLLFLHTEVPNSNSHAKYLLQLEFNSCLGLIDFRLKGLLVWNKGRKLACIEITPTLIYHYKNNGIYKQQNLRTEDPNSIELTGYSTNLAHAETCIFFFKSAQKALHL